MPISVATQVSMIRQTGGVTVVHGGESSYGHFGEVPEFMQSEVGGINAPTPFVDIVLGSLSGITAARSVNEPVVVDGETYYVRRAEPIQEDGGLVRLWLSEARYDG